MCFLNSRALEFLEAHALIEAAKMCFSTFHIFLIIILYIKKEKRTKKEQKKKKDKNLGTIY